MESAFSLIVIVIILFGVPIFMGITVYVFSKDCDWDHERFNIFPKIEQQEESKQDVKSDKPQTLSTLHSEFNQQMRMLQEDKRESVQELQTQMTLQQREAVMCLVAYFGGTIDVSNKNPIIVYLYKQAAFFFGMPWSVADMAQMMLRYQDFSTLVRVLRTIKPVKAKEFFLLTCYDLANISGNPLTMQTLYEIAADIGYDGSKFSKLVSQYKHC